MMIASITAASAAVGSSDAAGTLMLLRDHWGLDLDDAALGELAADLGVPGPRVIRALTLERHLAGTELPDGARRDRPALLHAGRLGRRLRHRLLAPGLLRAATGRRGVAKGLISGAVPALSARSRGRSC